MVPPTEARGDALACLQEERTGVCRAKEWWLCASSDGLRPLRRPRNGAHYGPPLCGGTALRQLLSAVVQAEGEAPRRGESDQALSCSVDALSPRAGASQGDRGREETATRSVSFARSYRALGQDSRNPGGTRQSCRSSCWTGARPATRLHKHRAGDHSHFCEDARQDGESRRAACHAPATSSAL